MKITGYRVEQYEMKMDRPIGDANGVVGEDISGGSVLWIETDEGITGVAPGGNPAVGRLFHLIEGEDPRSVVGLWMRLVDFVFKGGNEGEMNAAINAIDTALWDLKAKIADEPLWQTFGAREGRTKAYASGIDLCLDDDAIFAFYRRMAERGVDGGKLKIGLDMKTDLRRIGIMQEALSIASDRPRLLIDSNEYWSAKEAIIRIQRIEEDFDITWAEEPARRWDFDGLRQVVTQHLSGSSLRRKPQPHRRLLPPRLTASRRRSKHQRQSQRLHWLQTSRQPLLRLRTPRNHDELPSQLRSTPRRRPPQPHDDGSRRPRPRTMHQLQPHNRRRLHPTLQRPRPRHHHRRTSPHPPPTEPTRTQPPPQKPLPPPPRRRPLHRPTHQRRGALVGGVSNNSLRLLPTISTA